MTSATIRLGEIAHARSGDKGSHANVAVIAYTPAGFAWLRERLTADAVAGFFRPMAESRGGPGPLRVERFEAANVLGLNFLLYDVLAGGASQSPYTDSQGKTLGLALLQMELPRPANLEEMLRPGRVTRDAGP